MKFLPMRKKDLYMINMACKESKKVVEVEEQASETFLKCLEWEEVVEEDLKNLKKEKALQKI
jgi:hypothetical protein